MLARHDRFDYSSFVWTGIIAAQSYGLNSDPELGRAAGYTRYYWRAFADGVSGTYFTEAFVPIISPEDPRYYTLGHGGFFHRFGYSVSRTVLTKTDSGGTISALIAPPFFRGSIITVAISPLHCIDVTKEP